MGACEADLDALLAYTANPFELSGTLVLEDEPFAAVWDEYAAAAKIEGLFPVLQRALVQLRFPIREGLSDIDAYRAATRRGDLSGLGPDGLFEGGLQLVAPDRLRLELHPTPAGRIPILTAPEREDFVAIVQALTRRNAPTPLSDSMGALMVSGYNNWDRVGRYRRSWEDAGAEGTWGEALRVLSQQRARYQDRFILLSEGPYSGVPSADLGLDVDVWLRTSHALRKEHECAHYYCRRVLGSMRSNALDEWVADAAAALFVGAQDPGEWVRRFLTHPTAGRLRNYCEGLTAHQAEVVRQLVDRVGERTPWSEFPRGTGLQGRAETIRTLASGTLEEQWAATLAA